MHISHLLRSKRQAFKMPAENEMFTGKRPKKNTPLSGSCLIGHQQPAFNLPTFTPYWMHVYSFINTVLA